MLGRLRARLARRLRPDRLGRAGERRALWYLRLRGYQVLERNARSRRGEIDLIVRRGRRVAFVEVKARQQVRRGRPEEAVDRRKQLRIARLAEAYCATASLKGCHFHFDVVSVFWDGWRFRIRHIADAFTLQSVPGRPWEWK